MTPDLEMIANEMSQSVAHIGVFKVVAGLEHPNGVFKLYVDLPEALPQDTVASLCRGWAQVVRKFLPDRQDNWSSSIDVTTPLDMEVGVYWLGWAGHEDAWVTPSDEDGGDPYRWEVLYQRLDAYLRVRGTSDWQGGGDYFLFDEWNGDEDHSITIYRIEFLTPDLVSGIQEVLRDGYETSIVRIVLDLLPPVDGIASEAVVEIHVDRIVETWDRAFMVERLGERLKL